MTLKIDYEKIYNYLMIILAFSLPLSRAMISITTILLLLIWIIEGDFKNKFSKIKQSRALMYLLAFIALMFLSLLWTDDYSRSVRFFKYLVYYSLIFIAITKFDSKYSLNVVNAFLVGVTISVVIAYGVFFEFWHFKDATVQNPTPFFNHIEYSIILSFASTILLNRLFINSYNLKQKILYGILAILVIGNLFLIEGRTGQVSFLFALTVLLFLNLKISFKSIIVSFMVLLITIYSSYHFSQTFKNRVDLTKTNLVKAFADNNYNSSVGIRLAYWKVAPNVIKDNLLLGVGVGDISESFKKEVSKEKYNNFSSRLRAFMSYNNPHSEFLLITSQFGLVGFFIFIMFLFYLFREISTINSAEIRNISIVFNVIFLLSFFADTLLATQLSLAFFMLFNGVFLSNIKRLNSSKEFM